MTARIGPEALAVLASLRAEVRRLVLASHDALHHEAWAALSAQLYKADDAFEEALTAAGLTLDEYAMLEAEGLHAQDAGSDQRQSG